MRKPLTQAAKRMVLMPAALLALSAVGRHPSRVSKMSKKVLTAMLLTYAGMLSWGGYEYYQVHHLSPEFRQIVAAGIEEDHYIDLTSLSGRFYAIALQKLVKTKKDAELFQNIQKISKLKAESNSLWEGADNLEAGERKLEAYDEFDLKTTKSKELRQQILSQENQEAHNAVRWTQKASRQQAENDDKQAAKLYRDICKELGVKYYIHGSFRVD
jgi:hypothetical protein